MEAKGLVPGLLRDRLRQQGGGKHWMTSPSQALSWAKAPSEEHVLCRRGSSLAGRTPLGSVDSHCPQFQKKRPFRAEPTLHPPAFLAHFKESLRVESVPVYVFFLCQSCWVSLLNVI